MLTIQEFQSSYLVNREDPNPEKLRARLDDIVQKRLPTALDDLLEYWERQNPGLWFIRDLEIELDINAAWDDDLVADLWAGKILRQLMECSTGSTPAKAIFFPDPAAYRSHFLMDLAAGRAWGVWYYQQFDGLRALPTSTAICTALAEDPDLGVAALALLEPEELEKILAALSETDARRLLAAYAAASEDDSHQPGDRALFELCWQAWQVPRRSLAEAGEIIFHLVLAIRRGAASRPLAPLIRVFQALSRLSRLLRHLDGQSAGRVLSVLSGGDPASLYTTTGRADGEALQPLLGAEPEWIWQVGQALGGPGSVSTIEAGTLADEEVVGTAVRYTSLGGAFLLLPSLAELPLARLTRDWAGLKGLPAVTLLRFLVLADSLGGVHVERAWMDPLLRDLLLLPPSFSAEDLSAWTKSIPPRKWMGFVRQLADWQAEAGFSANPRLALTPLPKTSRLLILDVSRNLWRAVAEPERVKLHLHPGEVLYSDEPDLLIPAGSTGIRIAPLDEIQEIEAGTSLAEVRARLSQVGEDWEYLQPPSHLAGSKAGSAAIALAARDVLHLFAGRLPGFSRSGPEYLFRNFLDFSASLEEGADRRIVRVGKPPLSLVLGMAGQNRQTYILDWLDDRPFELYQQE
ncbi:MAG TPA: hypothetical protein VMC09_11540 [Anaerolineales bacterium]|nr:hypothetical protein [Anaerolineales bacterium]